MKVGYTVKEPLPDVRALSAVIVERCREAGVRGLSNCLIRNFRTKNRTPNAKGFPRSNFWEDAAESVTSAVENGEMVATISKEGVRLRWMGGTVKPRAGKKALAIPADPSVAGVWPSEYSGELRLIWPKGRTSGVLMKPGKSKEEPAKILYRLVGATRHNADDSVIPADDTLISAVVAAMRSVRISA